MKTLFLCFLLFILALLAHASNEQLQCSKKGTVIFFINGIDTSPETFDKEKDRIREIERQSRSPEYNLRVDPRVTADVDGYYNRTDGAIADIWESMGQWMDETTGNAIDAKMAAKLVIAQKPLPNEIQKKKIEIQQQRQTQTTWRQADLNGMVAQINGHLSSGKKVIILSESQGNFYANEIFNAISEIQKNDASIDRLGVLTNFQVASPTSPINPKRSMLKLRNDIVAPFGHDPSYEPTYTAPPELPEAKRFDHSPIDWMNHIFLNTYALPDSYNFKIRKINSNDEYKTIRHVFVEELHNSALTLADNCPTTFTGTVQLMQTKIDLLSSVRFRIIANNDDDRFFLENATKIIWYSASMYDSIEKSFDLPGKNNPDFLEFSLTPRSVGRYVLGTGYLEIKFASGDVKRVLISQALNNFATFLVQGPVKLNMCKSQMTYASVNLTPWGDLADCPEISTAEELNGSILTATASGKIEGGGCSFTGERDYHVCDNPYPCNDQDPNYFYRSDFSPNVNGSCELMPQAYEICGCTVSLP